jgi:hypothetical protein
VTLLRSSLRISGGGLPDLLITIAAGSMASGGIAALFGCEAATIPWFGVLRVTHRHEAPDHGRTPPAAGAGPISVGRLHEGGQGDGEKGGSPSLQAAYPGGELNKMFG